VQRKTRESGFFVVGGWVGWEESSDTHPTLLKLFQRYHHLVGRNNQRALRRMWRLSSGAMRYAYYTLRELREQLMN
jgi:hypothetical protein